MKKIIFVFFLSISIFSCRKDTAVPEAVNNGGTVTPVVPFVPLTVGSFWVYDFYTIDTLGNDTYNNSDTVKIIKDSIINGNIFAVFKGSYEQKCDNCFEFRRDSSGYLLDERSFILFSATNFTDTLEKLMFGSNGWIFFKMNHKDSIISVPAGNLPTYEYERVLYDPIFSPKAQHCSTFYSYGIGVIKTHWKYSSPPNYYDSRLVSYYIAPYNKSSAPISILRVNFHFLLSFIRKFVQIRFS